MRVACDAVRGMQAAASLRQVTCYYWRYHGLGARHTFAGNSEITIKDVFYAAIATHR